MFRGWKYFWLLASLVLSGCHYQWGREDLYLKTKTISVPYVEGDETGDLTALLIKEMARSGLRYTSGPADLLLEVKIVEREDENIGFRYDRKKCGKLKKRTIPSETRFTLIAEIKLIEQCSQKEIICSTRIKTSLDFDHEFYSSTHAMNIFSLGQLNDRDAAYDAALHPLHKQLAEKIVDCLIYSH